MDIDNKQINDQASVIRRQWREKDTETPFKAVTGIGLPKRFVLKDQALSFFHKHPGRCLVSQYLSDGSVKFIAYRYAKKWEYEK